MMTLVVKLPLRQMICGSVNETLTGKYTHHSLLNNTNETKKKLINVSIIKIVHLEYFASETSFDESLFFFGL